MKGTHNNPVSFIYITLSYNWAYLKGNPKSA